jgi:methyl-accepting chemotaxis protein
MKLGIRGQLITIFTAVFTLAFAVFVGVFYWRFTQLARDLAYEGLLYQVESVAYGLGDELQNEWLTRILEEEDGREAFTQYFVEGWLSTYSADTVMEVAIVRVTDTRLENLVYIRDGQLVALDDPNLLYNYAFADRPDPEATREIWQVSMADVTFADPFEQGGRYWTTATSPIFVDGQASPYVLVVDLRVDNVVSDVLNAIRSTILIALALGYPILLGAVFAVASVASRAIKDFTQVAQELDEKDTYQPEALNDIIKRRDEIGDLARVFDKMAQQVRQRVEKLKSEVVKLKVEIDRSKQAEQVAEITATDYFQELRAKSAALRKSKIGTDLLPPEGDSSPSA